MDLRELLIALLCLTLPPWVLAGFADWLCHRRSSIDSTSGPPEPALHIVLYLLIALPVALGLYLQITALLLAVMAACVLAHVIVSLWDTRYAQPRRFISPLEQQIHSYLEMLPLFAWALVAVLHWDAVRNPDWALQLRPRPVPYSTVVLLVLVPGLLLILEELARCRRALRHA